MARDIPAVQSLTSGGLAPTYSAITANNDQVQNNCKRLVHVKNGSGGSINVTVSFGRTVDGSAIASKVIAIPATSDKFIGPFPAAYNQGDGSVYVDYSATTSVTRAVLELPAV